MTIYTAPAAFDCKLADGYTYSPVQPFARTQMDSGLAKHRRRFKTIPTKINVSWMVKKELMSSFRYFYYELARWDWFYTRIIFDDEIKPMKARFTNGETPFVVENVGNVCYKVSAEIEVMEADVISEYDYLMRDENGVMRDLLNPLHQRVNVEMPVWDWEFPII